MVESESGIHRKWCELKTIHMKGINAADNALWPTGIREMESL